MKNLKSIVAVLAVSSAITVVPHIDPAMATVVNMDHFAVYKNGNLYFHDPFSDDLPPPSTSATYSNNSPVSTSTRGTFTETLGTVEMGGAGSLGEPFFPTAALNTGSTIFTGQELARRHRVRFNTNSSNNPANIGSGLKNDDDITIMGLFDLSQPDSGSTNYGIGFSDFSGGNLNAGDDLFRLRVIKTSTSGNQIVSFSEFDSTSGASVITPIGSDLTDFNNQQILLRLRTDGRTNPTSNAVFADYAYVNGGVDITSGPTPAGLTFYSLGQVNGFSNELFTRAEYSFLQRVDELNFGALTAGSPTSISQEVTVGTGLSEINVSFNYRFETTTGSFEVFLDGVQVGTTILAPGIFDPAFTSVMLTIDDPTTLLALEGITTDLMFTVDGSPGSKILIDNILVEGVAGFQGGNFEGDGIGEFWTVTTDPNSTSGLGGAGILTIVAAPEPSTLAVFVFGLAGLGLMRRRKRMAA